MDHEKVTRNKRNQLRIFYTSFKNCSEDTCNLWFTMRDHYTNPIWLTDLPYDRSPLQDRIKDIG